MRRLPLRNRRVLLRDRRAACGCDCNPSPMDGLLALELASVVCGEIGQPPIATARTILPDPIRYIHTVTAINSTEASNGGNPSLSSFRSTVTVAYVSVLSVIVPDGGTSIFQQYLTPQDRAAILGLPIPPYSNGSAFTNLIGFGTVFAVEGGTLQNLVGVVTRTARYQIEDGVVILNDAIGQPVSTTIGLASPVFAPDGAGGIVLRTGIIGPQSGLSRCEDSTTTTDFINPVTTTTTRVYGVTDSTGSVVFRRNSSAADGRVVAEYISGVSVIQYVDGFNGPPEFGPVTELPPDNPRTAALPPDIDPETLRPRPNGCVGCGN